MAKLTTKEFQNFWTYFNDENHQVASVEALYKELPNALLDDQSEWVKTYRNPPAPPPSAAVKGPVTPALMGRFSGHAASSFDDVFCNDFNDLIATTGFDKDLTAFRMLISQMAHETSNWCYMKELGSTAYFTSMYEGRGDLGNTQNGDGARFSGCGAIQCTGRANFQASYDYLHEKRGLNDPRIMAEGTSYTADIYPFSICIGWLINNNYLSVCKTGDIEYATRVLNGGYNGLADRQHWYEKAKVVITSL